MCPYCKSKKLITIGSGYKYCIICKKIFCSIYNILEFYKTQDWSLVKIEKNDKSPVDEKEWQNKEHRDPKEWSQWVKDGYNIGLNLGLSGLMVIDFDSVEEYEKLKNRFNETLVQKTTKGYHYIYQRQKNLPNKNLRPKHLIEIRGIGQQIVIEPSVTDGFKRHFLELTEPKEISEETKNFLLSEIKNKSNNKLSYDNNNVGEIIVPEGRRHYDLISAGGHFKNFGFNPKQINLILRFINHRYYSSPKERKEIDHICNSLYNYQLSEDEESKREIIDYIKTAQEASKAEIEIALFSERVKGDKKKKLDSLLVNLIQERKIYKENKSYKIVSEAGWSDNLAFEVNKPLWFKMPYLYDLSNFMVGDVILISAKTGIGKTTLAVNICKRLAGQNIKPYLLETEPTKRFLRIAHRLGLRENQFYYNKKVVNPITVEFENNSVNIIDWLDPANAADFTQTSRIFNHLNEQAREHGAVIIVFMQLRSDDKQFAKDLVNQYPSLAVNFILEEDRIHGVFKVIKNNDPRIPITWEIPTLYDSDTKEIKRADEL